MLVGFSYKNFASFRNENVFSMLANEADSQYSKINTFSTTHGELLKNALVFGANGSGKSNFFEAIRYMSYVVLSDVRQQETFLARCPSFAYQKSASLQPTGFEISFIYDAKNYEYGFEILNGEIVKEYLYVKLKRRKMVYSRTSPNFSDINLSSDMDNVKHLKQNTRRDTLFLYWASAGNNTNAMNVVKWFNNLAVFESDEANSMLANNLLLTIYIPKRKQNMLNLLKLANPNMLSFDLKDDDPDVLIIEPKYTQNFYNENWEKIGTLERDMLYESGGTNRLFELAYPILNALETGGTIIIDEFEARLHPSLVKYLVMLFNSIDKNPNNAQLICVTHSVLLLDEQIRRDQVYFTEKDSFGVSQLYSLSEFKGVRKDSKLLKQYLLGYFGAIPKLEDFLLNTEDGEAFCEQQEQEQICKAERE